MTDFIRDLQQACRERAADWDPDDQFGPLFHAVEFGGEAGEILNEVKKLERERVGAVGSRTTKQKLADEMGDGLVTLVNLANKYDIDLEQATRDKFNASSEKNGFPHRV